MDLNKIATELIQKIYLTLLASKIYEFLEKTNLIREKISFSKYEIREYFLTCLTIISTGKQINSNNVERYVIEVNMDKFQNPFLDICNKAKLSTYKGISLLVEAFDYFIQSNKLNEFLNIEFELIFKYLSYNKIHLQYGNNYNYIVPFNKNLANLSYSDHIAVKNFYHYFTYNDVFFNSRQSGLTTCNIYRTIFERIISDEKIIEFHADHPRYELPEFERIFKSTKLFGFNLDEYYEIKKRSNCAYLSIGERNIYYSRPDRSNFLNKLENNIIENYFLI